MDFDVCKKPVNSAHNSEDGPHVSGAFQGHMSVDSIVALVAWHGVRSSRSSTHFAVRLAEVQEERERWEEERQVCLAYILQTGFELIRASHMRHSSSGWKS